MKSSSNSGTSVSRAVALGDIARIYADKGDVDQALKLHQEELEVYEQLGDKRSRAVTLGDIARIYADKGDVDQALKLHRERLEGIRATRGQALAGRDTGVTSRAFTCTRGMWTRPSSSTGKRLKVYELPRSLSENR